MQHAVRLGAPVWRIRASPKVVSNARRFALLVEARVDLLRQYCACLAPLAERFNSGRKREVHIKKISKRPLKIRPGRIKLVNGFTQCRTAASKLYFLASACEIMHKPASASRAPTGLRCEDRVRAGVQALQRAAGRAFAAGSKGIAVLPLLTRQPPSQTSGSLARCFIMRMHDERSSAGHARLSNERCRQSTNRRKGACSCRP